MSATDRGSRQGRLMPRLLLGVVTLLTCLWSYAAPAQALPAPAASSCAGVWVVVDYGALGGTTTACAGSYSTGMAALRSVFTPILDNGMVVKINGLPTTPNIQEDYWSYWHASRQADGSYSSWTYSSVGPSSSHPVAGGAEGWRYEPVNGGYVAPGAVPPKQTATTQAPATTAPATAARTTTAAARATTAGGQTTQAAVVTTASDTPTATPSSTDMSSPTATSAAADSRVEGATIAPAAPANTSTSSLYGGLVAIAAIGAGAGGVLLWRRRVAARG
jgi:hypothetical protein